MICPLPDHDPPPPRTLQEMQSEARASDSRGLVCACGFTSLPVLYTRPQPGGVVVRVRQCRRCGKRYYCEEVMQGEVKGRKRD